MIHFLRDQYDGMMPSDVQGFVAWILLVTVGYGGICWVARYFRKRNRTTSVLFPRLLLAILGGFICSVSLLLLGGANRANIIYGIFATQIGRIVLIPYSFIVLTTVLFPLVFGYGRMFGNPDTDPSEDNSLSGTKITVMVSLITAILILISTVMNLIFS